VTTSWVSSRLFDLLLDQKNYIAAAERVSGSADTFVLYSQIIVDTMEKSLVSQGGNPTLDLQQILAAAKDDIQDHEKWEAVLEDLSKDDSTVEPLREAFKRAAVVREKLLREVKGIEWMRTR
jgi:predicted ATPase with chaperone activity